MLLLMKKKSVEIQENYSREAIQSFITVICREKALCLVRHCSGKSKLQDYARAV